MNANESNRLLYNFNTKYLGEKSRWEEDYWPPTPEHVKEKQRQIQVGRNFINCSECTGTTSLAKPGSKLQSQLSKCNFILVLTARLEEEGRRLWDPSRSLVDNPLCC